MLYEVIPGRKEIVMVLTQLTAEEHNQVLRGQLDSNLFAVPKPKSNLTFFAEQSKIQLQTALCNSTFLYKR